MLLGGLPLMMVKAADNTTGSGATTAINEYQFAGTALLTIHGQEKSAEVLVTVLDSVIYANERIELIKIAKRHRAAETHTPPELPSD